MTTTGNGKIYQIVLPNVGAEKLQRKRYKRVSTKNKIKTLETFKALKSVHQKINDVKIAF